MNKNSEKMWKDYLSNIRWELGLYITFLFFFIFIIFIFFDEFHFYFELFVVIIALLPILREVCCYSSLKKVKKYIEQNHLNDKIGTIEFWNPGIYILTEYYMIIIKKNMIFSFPYSKIKEIYKNTSKYWKYTKQFLHIKLKDGQEYKLLIKQKEQDISNYLIYKNNEIKRNSQFEKI